MIFDGFKYIIYLVENNNFLIFVDNTNYIRLSRILALDGNTLQF